MAEKIDPTWLAWSLERPAERGAVQAALERVRAHYAGLVSYELDVRVASEGRLGLATLGTAEPAWPTFERDGRLAFASAYPPAGWREATGGLAPRSREAALALARAALAGPEALVRDLVAPALVGALDLEAGRLAIVNDAIGAGRLFEARFAGGTVWSNRAGAGHLFAGIAPEPDRDGWLALAAVGWFCGRATPLAGVRRVERGTVIRAGANGVERAHTDAAGEMVRPSRRRRAELLERAGEAAVGQVRLAAELWPEAPVIHLSGGRDSRLVAAAAVSAGVEAVYRTSDAWPGEADIARRLVGLAPRPMTHVVVRDDTESAGPQTPLLERATRTQLLHDGMRQPSKIRFDVPLPRGRPDRATLPGWGGEIAHSFYVNSSRQLWEVRLRGRAGALRRLLQASRRRHDAAHPEGYELARELFERRLDEGAAHGLSGPDLLDWFYLTERFVNRFEIGADSQCISAYATPAFIRAAFATTPRQRTRSWAHRTLIPALVPEWADVPFYRRPPGPRPGIRRKRLWESAADAEALEAIVSAGGDWEAMYRTERVREMWARARAGEAPGHWETVFERIACRAAFGELLRALERGAAHGPPLLGAGARAKPARAAP